MTESEFAREQYIAGIPKRYISAQFMTKSEEQKEAMSKLSPKIIKVPIKNFPDAVFLGNVGVGKTHLLSGILNAIIKTGTRCKYITETALLELQASKNFVEINRHKYSEFLVIDEIGTNTYASWQMAFIDEVVNYRYNEMLPTWYASNLDILGFKAQVGARIADRLRDNNVHICVIKGESLRGTM